MAAGRPGWVEVREGDPGTEWRWGGVMQDPRASSEEHGLPKENDGESSWGHVGGTAAPPERLTAIQMVATFSRAGPSVPPKTRDAPRPPLP